MKPISDSAQSSVVDLGFFKCHHRVCDACHNLLIPCKRIISTSAGKRYKICLYLVVPALLFTVLFVQDVIGSVWALL